MLMDILGILIGFCSIMLLFSLLVTALVQGAQATLDLRFKNLKTVIHQFLKNMDTIENTAAEKIMAQLEKRHVCGLYSTALPINFSGNQLKVTSINKEEFITIIGDTPDIGIDHKEQLKHKVLEHFDTLEVVMKQRFKQWMHQISIMLAFTICFLFQLNSFDLLNKLNKDSTFRHQTSFIAENLNIQSKDNSDSLISIQGQLSALNFKIKPEEWRVNYFSFSVNTLSHWIGVIFSSILISLGAPFWFNRLKDMASLRDKLSNSH